MQQQEEPAQQVAQDAISWIRDNVSVLSLAVALLMLFGGVLSTIVATVLYVSTLATADDVTIAVNNAVTPLNSTINVLSDSVNTLSTTVQTLNETALSLNDTVQDLDDTVGGLEENHRLMMLCTMELHGPWRLEDGTPIDAPTDTEFYRRGAQEPYLPAVCHEARRRALRLGQ